MQCLTCASLNGEKRISPGPVIYSGKHWLVDHAFPTGLLGWLVIVLKMHKEALHELSLNEFSELARIQSAATSILHNKLKSEKEYLACFAEGKGFQHIHFHIIPKTEAITANLKGPKVFQLIKKDRIQKYISTEEIVNFCNLLKTQFPLTTNH